MTKETRAAMLDASGERLRGIELFCGLLDMCGVEYLEFEADYGFQIWGWLATPGHWWLATGDHKFGDLMGMPVTGKGQ